MKVLLSALLILMSTISVAGGEHVLWYRHGAKKWTEALPLGNGRLGAMVYGTVPKEVIRLNEETLWAGQPYDTYPDNFAENLKTLRKMILDGRLVEARDFGIANMTKEPTSFRSYEPLGDLHIELNHGTKVDHYRRTLDLQTGVARVRYSIGDTIMERDVLVSAVDDVIAVRLAGKISGTVRLARKEDARFTARGANCLRMDGQVIDVPKSAGGPEPNSGGSGPGGKHMKFAGRLYARAKGGTIRAESDHLVVEGAEEVVLLFTAATDFNLDKLNFDRAIDPGKKADAILARAAKRSWEAILRDHVAEHRALFDRVAIELGASKQDELPTDRRLATVASQRVDDPGLVELYFQFGRYLLMSSARRPGRIPAGLQGIWSDRMWSPWEADFHLNINCEMNYWPADLCNLSETVDPLAEWFSHVARKGQRSAARLYGADGWVAFLAVNLFGRTTPSASSRKSQFVNGVLDPLAGVWMSLTFWRHYQFTRDKDFLRERAYPLLKGAATFLLDYLVEGPDGKLMIIPSTSPENRYIDPKTGRPIRVTHDSTYHLTLVREVFQSVIRAAEVLDRDAEFRGKLEAALRRIPPFQIGKDGTIQEWIEDYQERDPGHRHMSHLLGLYPLAQITPKTPELFQAARKTVERRLRHGGGRTGWSRAWVVNLYARLLDGAQAYKNLQLLLGTSTQPNLFDRPTELQIDGNFGGAAGIAEMLLQSHAGTIHLLPALPPIWASGYVRGLKARGGFIIAIRWQDGKLVSATIDGRPGTDCVVRYQGHRRKVSMKTGAKVQLAGTDFR